MGYFFIALALASGAVKGYCGKRTSDFVSEAKDAILANIIRMVLCIIIGFFMALLQNGIKAFCISPLVLAATLLSGISTSMFVVSWLISVKKGAYMMIDVFCMIGVIIPLIGGIICFDEGVKLTQWVGFIILIFAVIIMCSYNNSIKSKITASSFFILLLCGISNGFTDFSQKMFIKLTANIPIAIFNFYTYIFSAIALCIFFIIFNSKNKEKVSIKKSVKPIFGYVLIMSVCLFLNSFFKTAAAGRLPAAELYPLTQGGALIISTVMSSVLFGEKTNKKCILGIILSFVGIITINVL